MLKTVFLQPQLAPGILPSYFYKKTENNKLAVVITKSPDF